MIDSHDTATHQDRRRDWRGRMGQPIIGHMVRKGFTVVAYDIDATKARGGGEAGRRAGPTVRRRSRADSDAILVCVGYDRELRELMSADGLLGDLRRGTIVAVLSTVHPRTVQELAEVASAVRRARGRFDGLPRRPRGGRGHAAVVHRRRCRRRRAPRSRCSPAFSTDIVHTGGGRHRAGGQGGEQPRDVGVPDRQPRSAGAGEALRRGRRAAARGAPQEQRRQLRAAALGRRTRWRGPRTTWRSSSRWRTTSVSACRRRA